MVFLHLTLKIDVTFSRISRTEFQISQKGIISTAKMNLRTAYSYYSVVYVQLKGTTTTGQAVDTTVSVSVTIVALGMGSKYIYVRIYSQIHSYTHIPVYPKILAGRIFSVLPKLCHLKLVDFTDKTVALLQLV